MKPELIDEFRRHIGVEAGNALAYLAAYGSLRATAWEGFSKVFKNDAAGEFGHAQNWVKYLARNDTPVKAIEPAPLVGVPEGPRELFRLRADLEGETLASMNVVYAAAADGPAEVVEWLAQQIERQELEAKQARDDAAQIERLDDAGLALLNDEWR